METIGSRAELEAQGVVEVVVPDLAAALDFYRRVGFQPVRMTPTFVTLRYGNSLLFVAENARATTTPRWASLRLIVDDVDAVWARVNQAQLPIGVPIGDRDYGLRDFTVKDPAGFDIRFAKVLA